MGGPAMIHHTDSELQSQVNIKGCVNSLEYDRQRGDELTKTALVRKELNQQSNIG